MRRFRSAVTLAAVLGLSASPALARPRHARHAKHAVKKAPPPVSAPHKKALAELFGGFKFGMTKDQVLGVLRKKIDADYQARIRATTDIAEQDKLRAREKSDVARIAHSYIAFEGKRTGWDVSIVENEFAHHTNEAMMDRWENQGGKNQRRFFFFYEGHLWKMFISLDVSILPEDKRNFDTFKGVMEAQYGPGDVQAGTITWRAGSFDVRAVDRLRDYDALGLAIEDPHVRGEVVALREKMAPAKKGQSAIIKAIVDKDDSDHPDVKANTGAVDAVIKAAGGGK